MISKFPNYKSTP